MVVAPGKARGARDLSRFSLLAGPTAAALAQLRQLRGRRAGRRSPADLSLLAHGRDSVQVEERGRILFVEEVSEPLLCHRAVRQLFVEPASRGDRTRPQFSG
jgi:hypothetical protein